MIGHLSGPRVSALLDGRLSAREQEEAWHHVYACHPCRDLVEREGWVKTRLAGLGGDETTPAGAPSSLKGSLLSMPPLGGLPHPPVDDVPGRRAPGALVVSTGAVGAAVLGVLALTVAPGSLPANERRPPVTRISTVVPGGGPSAPASPGVPTGGPAAPASAPLQLTELARLVRGPLRGALP